jgi:hypothetical protein
VFRYIDSKVWSDPKMRKLPPNGKLLFLYFITNPHTHVSGIYYLPKAIMVHESGLKKSELDTLCHTLSSLEMVRFDDEKEIVWVINMMEYQGRGEKNVRSAAFHLLEDLHNSFLIKDFIQKHPQVLEYFPEEKQIPYRYPIPENEDHATPDTRVLIPDTKDLKPKTSTPKSPPGEDADFLRFWEAFPKLRKQGPGAARDAWKRAVKKCPADTIVQAAADYAASPVGRGKYVKGPVPWLNQECWNDDRAAWQRQDSTDLFTTTETDAEKIARIARQNAEQRKQAGLE